MRIPLDMDATDCEAAARIIGEELARAGAA
jgi:hypothetical protein